MSPATVLDLTRRASDAVRSEYEENLKRIRGAEVLYVDETQIRVQGKKYWIWIFNMQTETSVVIQKSQGMKVLLEIEEAAPLDKALRSLYRKLNAALEADTPPEMRRKLLYMARAALRRWIRRE